MSETKYRWLFDDLSGMDEPDTFGDYQKTWKRHPTSVRYRVEQRDGRDILVYDPPPAEAPSEPEAIDQERWARKGECGWWIGHPDGEPPHRDAPPQIVRVISKHLYDALRYKLGETTAFKSPSNPPSEPSVEEAGWLYWDNSEPTKIGFNFGWQKQPALRWDNVVPGIVRSKAADDELRERAEAGYGSAFSASKLATLTRERDDLSRKLAVAEGELTIARQEWDDQYAKFIKVATERDEYVTRLNRAQQKLAESTSERIRDHAPAARYPEVVEFLDAVGSGPWSMSAGSCEGKASYYVQSFRITKGTWFAGDTLAAACRAALDSRKERADG